jgi:hypothetical protein
MEPILVNGIPLKSNTDSVAHSIPLVSLLDFLAVSSHIFHYPISLHTVDTLVSEPPPPFPDQFCKETKKS